MLYLGHHVLELGPEVCENLLIVTLNKWGAILAEQVRDAVEGASESLVKEGIDILAARLTLLALLMRVDLVRQESNPRDVVVD